MGMSYVKLDGVDGDYFECKPYRGLFSVESCARNWKAARGAVEDSNRCLCRNCSVGALHAGQEPVRLTPKSMCARCGKTDQRLIRGAICVSCYNRERELLVGRNSKGAFPVHAKRLRSLDISVRGASPSHIDRVCNPVEAAVIAFRHGDIPAIRMLTGTFLQTGHKRRPRIYITGLIPSHAPVQMRLF